MKKRWLLLLVPVVAAAFVAGCGGDGDPMEPPVDQGPPDLSGTYALVSMTAVITQGATVGPPIAVGTNTLTQNPASGGSATGSMSADLTFTNPLDGSVVELRDEGTYTVRADGTWEQSGTLGQAVGTFTLAGNVLTVIVTEPPASVSTTVWQRQ